MQKNISKAKVNRWMDIKKGVTFFGVDVKINGDWCHLSENDNPLFYSTEKEAKNKVKEINNSIPIEQ